MNKCVKEQTVALKGDTKELWNALKGYEKVLNTSGSMLKGGGEVLKGDG